MSGEKKGSLSCFATEWLNWFPILDAITPMWKLRPSCWNQNFYKDPRELSYLLNTGSGMRINAWPFDELTNSRVKRAPRHMFTPTQVQGFKWHTHTKTHTHPCWCYWAGVRSQWKCGIKQKRATVVYVGESLCKARGGRDVVTLTKWQFLKVNSWLLSKLDSLLYTWYGITQCAEWIFFGGGGWWRGWGGAFLKYRFYCPGCKYDSSVSVS